VTSRTDLPLAAPHHDGSPLYASTLVPALGETVTVRLRVPAPPAGVRAYDRIHLRTTVDAEQRFIAASLERADDAESWWRAELVVHNTVTTYRWFLGGGPRGYEWLTAGGLRARDVTDAEDFRLVAGPALPSWPRDAVVYQIFPDRFARSAAADGRTAPAWAQEMGWDEIADLGRGHASVQLYGGDLDGIVERLDYLEDLGVTCLYLTPVFPATSSHRYDAVTFAAVDPVLGGDSALERLTRAVHERGMRILGDITTNHCGRGHDWFVTAQKDPDSVERGFFYWDDDGLPVCWLDVPDLPKLNYASEELRDRMYRRPDSAVRRWLAAPYSFDGWRVDVANMTGRHGAHDVNHEVARGIRSAMALDNPDGLLVAEHTHDFTTDLTGDGWHGAMNYGGFTRPVWSWLHDPTHAPRFLGGPMRVPRIDGTLVMETMQDVVARVPWSGLISSFTLLGSHDTSRIATLLGGDRARHEVAAALLLTFPGIPMITYGDEVGMEGAFGEDGRRPMPWSGQGWDEDLRAVYRALVATRRSSTALRDGGLRWVYAGDDAIAYLREAPGETALVHLSRAAHPQIRLPARLLGGLATGRPAYGQNIHPGGEDVVLAGPGAQASIWVWPSP